MHADLFAEPGQWDCRADLSKQRVMHFTQSE